MGLIILISIFYLIGFGILSKGLYDFYKANSAKSWSETKATLIDSEIVEKSDDDGCTYKIKLEYIYSVHGKEYTNSRLAYGYSGSSSKSDQNAILNKIKSGKAFIIKYDPMNPKSSVVTTGITKSILLTLIGAFTWLLFVVGVTISQDSNRWENSIINQIKVIKK